jgi:hypothetical protein
MFDFLEEFRYKDTEKCGAKSAPFRESSEDLGIIVFRDEVV